MTETTNVRFLEQARQQPDADIVDLLEGMLARARKGEIIDLVVLYGTHDAFDRGYKLNTDHLTMAGYMSRVKREIEDLDDDD